MTTPACLISMLFGGRRARLQFTDSGNDPVATATHTFSGKSIGTPSSNRKILVFVEASGNTQTQYTPSSVTLDGAEMTLIDNSYSPLAFAGAGVSAWIIDKPTGTTAVVVLKTESNIRRHSIHIYRLTDALSSTPDYIWKSNSEGAASLAVSATYQAKSAIAGAVTSHNNDTGGIAWVNLTEDDDSSVESRPYSSASKNSNAAGSSENISATWTNAGRAALLVLGWK